MYLSLCNAIILTFNQTDVNHSSKSIRLIQNNFFQTLNFKFQTLNFKSGGTSNKEPIYNEGDIRNIGSIPWDVEDFLEKSMITYSSIFAWGIFVKIGSCLYSIWLATLHSVA